MSRTDKAGNALHRLSVATSLRDGVKARLFLFWQSFCLQSRYNRMSSNWRWLLFVFIFKLILKALYINPDVLYRKRKPTLKVQWYLDLRTSLHPKFNVTKRPQQEVGHQTKWDQNSDYSIWQCRTMWTVICPAGVLSYSATIARLNTQFNYVAKH